MIEDLADEFADFFMDKIQKIRDNLTENPTYKPTKKSTSRLAELRPFNQIEVKKIILNMKTKSCELDALPTKLLKEMHRGYFANHNKPRKHFTVGWCLCIWMEDFNYKAPSKKA